VYGTRGERERKREKERERERERGRERQISGPSKVTIHQLS